MSFKQYINEKSKKAVFSFGRFNPISKGHEDNAKFLKKTAKSLNAEPLLYTSHSQDHKKNPLNFEDKANYLEKFFNIKVPRGRDLKNAFQILEDLANQGYEEVYFVVGEDRVKDFQSMKKYAAEWGIKKFDIIESGKRTKGVSGTDMRNFVKDGNFESFSNSLPSKATKKDAEDLFELVRKGMNYNIIENNIIDYINEVTLSKKSNFGGIMTMKVKNGRSKLDKDREKFLINLGMADGISVSYEGMDLKNTPNENIMPGIKDKDNKNNKFIFKIDNKIITIISTEGIMKKYLIHKNNAKGNTRLLTAIKETASAIIFEIGSEISQDKFKEILFKNNPSYREHYQPIFYTSAIAQLKAYKEIGIRGAKVFERQDEGGGYAQILYDKAKKLSGLKDPNNWNPGDLWVFTSKGISLLDKVNNISTLLELNDFVKSSILSKDIVSISLKQVEKKAKLKLNNVNTRPISDIDFSVNNINISTSFKSIFFNTNSGYILKGNMRGSADTLNLNYEGRFKGKGYAEGAFPAELWDDYKSSHNGDWVSTGVKTPFLTEDNFKKYQDIFKKYGSYISNDISDIKYEDLDELTGRRYIVISDNLKFVMDNKKDLFEYSFYSSQKLHDKASAFYKIAE